MHAQVASIPWYRRSDVNTVLALAGLLMPPLLWFVCFNLITGEIYYSRPVGPGRVETWSRGNRYLAYLLLGAQLLLMLYLYSSVAWVSVADRPEAEAVVSRYFETRKRPMADPPRDLYGPKFWGAVSPAQFEEHIGSIRARLGAVESFDLVSVEVGSDGWIGLEYDVLYERGRQRESFLVGRSGDDSTMRIEGHNITFAD